MEHPAIPRNKKANRTRAVLIGVVGLVPLWFGVDMAGFLQPQEYYLIYWAFGIAALFFACGAYFWWAKPRVGASIEFNENGFILRLLTRFRGDLDYDIDWKDLRELRLFRSGAVRSITFLFTHEAALRLGLVRETTRENASDKLVNRGVGVAMAQLGPSPEDVLKRLGAAAKDAGFKIEKTKSKFYLITTVEHWTVIPIQAAVRTQVDALEE